MLSPFILFSCSVKEDRGDCPAQLYVHSALDIPQGDVLVSIIQNGRVVNQGTMTREELYDGTRCFSVPRAMSVVTLFSGISDMVPLDEGRLLQREGCECDELWTFSEYADVKGDEYHHYGTPHKNFARLSIAFAGDMNDAEISISGTTNGYDVLDTRPIRGNATSSLRPSAREREYVVRLPRQTDNSLTLRVFTPGSDARLIAVGEMISRSGYNWDEEDLLDIRLTVDLSASNVNLGISDWDPVVFEIVEAGSSENCLCLTPVPCRETLTKAFKTLTLTGPVGLFGTIANSFRPLSSQTPDYAFNEKFTLSESGVYKPERMILPVNLQPGMSAVFHAYAPFDGDGISFSAASREGPPILHFCAPESDQYDLLSGCSGVYQSESFGVGERLGKVCMEFDHILSCISVRTSAEGISSLRVKAVSLEGVCGCGDYDMGERRWTVSEGSLSSYSRSVDVTLDGTSSQDVLSSSDGTAFMLVPQRVPDGAVLKLTVRSGDEETVLSTSIAGDIWPQGRDFVYVLSLDDKSGNASITPYRSGGDQNEQL